jgi:1-deoxy-D-xylulose-5-phosphate reductoisomerase
MKKIALIGSTGSIGKQVLNVCRRHPDKFKIISLSAGNNETLFLEQVNEFCPKIATLSKPLVNTPKCDTQFFFGEDAFKSAITSDADIVVVSLVGFKGILAVVDAIEKGKDIALANKESLVVGGELVMRLAKEKGVKITPIDSEHSAIWQALGFDYNTPFNKIILTASGGAFRDFSEDALKVATAKDALRHPNWNMGAKITVDCATLVNKAFEVVEAKWLYNTDFNNIEVIIHRESIIHSMVEFLDSSVIAQLSYPTMEIPIQLALDSTARLYSAVNSLDFKKLSKLSFEEVDKKRFPCFDLVVETAKKGGSFPAVINGANDTAVDLFLKGKISFPDIYLALKGAVDNWSGEFDGTLESLIKANDFAVNFVKTHFGE